MQEALVVVAAVWFFLPRCLQNHWGLLSPNRAFLIANELATPKAAFGLTARAVYHLHRMEVYRLSLRGNPWVRSRAGCRNRGNMFKILPGSGYSKKKKKNQPKKTNHSLSLIGIGFIIRGRSFLIIKVQSV